jgi:hypothetical protein
MLKKGQFEKYIQSLLLVEGFLERKHKIMKLLLTLNKLPQREGEHVRELLLSMLDNIQECSKIEIILEIDMILQDFYS